MIDPLVRYREQLKNEKNNIFRKFIGFDDLVDTFDSIFEDHKNTIKSNYPYFNMWTENAKTNSNEQEKYNKYTFIEVAVAGFDKSELQVKTINNKLEIKGNKNKESKGVPVGGYRGIAERDFCLEFFISPEQNVDSISLINGILKIKLGHKKEENSKIYNID